MITRTTLPPGKGPALGTTGDIIHLIKNHGCVNHPPFRKFLDGPPISDNRDASFIDHCVRFASVSAEVPSIPI